MTNNYGWTDNPTVAGISSYDPDVLNDCLMHLKYNNGTVPIGTIFACICSADWVPENALPVDGTEYVKSQFPTLWSEYLTGETPKLAVCTYAEYSADITAYGQCAKFAVDTVNNKFKVPTIKDGSYITQANSDAEIGKSYKESLPNITGYIEFDSINAQGVASGAFRCISSATPYGGASNTQNNRKDFTFDASRSSSVYQNDAKVQGDNVRLRWFVVVVNGTISQSAMDWSAWATSLNGKLNTDVSTNISATGKSFVAGLSMPSAKFETQTVGASGSSYTAPANGYYCGKCTGGGVVLENTSCNNFGSHSPQTIFAGGKTYLPCHKNDVVKFSYAGSSAELTFYYAEGDVESEV